MKKIFIILITVLSIAFSSQNIFAQGCVAIRSTGGYCSMQHADSSKWQLSINNRYFKSFRHFVGTEEQKQRLTLGTEVVNHSTATDIAIIRKMGSRWSLMLDMPILSNARSSLYE